MDGGTKTVWVSPAKGGKVPVFLGNGGELHGRVVAEMKSVLLGDEHPAYLDEAAHELLRTARTVARTVGLHQQDVLPTPGGLRWFPWVGTRCLRTLSILAEINGVACETDRISLWLALPDEGAFRALWQRVLTNPPSPNTMGEKVTPRAVEKFDEFIPDELLIRSCANERLALPEAMNVMRSLAEPPSIESEPTDSP